MLLLSSVSLFNLFYILHAYQNSSDDNGLSSRILHGTRANINDYPFFAALPNCGAAIISDRWLVTAAHCVDSKRGYVWVGAESIQSSQRYTYDKAIVHPLYKKIIYSIPINDIALLRLSQPLIFSRTVKAITLPKQDYERNAVHAFAGKGQDESGKVTNYLMSMNVRTIKKDECLSNVPSSMRFYLNSYVDQIAKVTICTKSVEDKQRLCYGDSGSPLVRNNTLVGIASYISNTNCFYAKIGMFANVGSFVNWIKHVTGIK